MSERSDEDDKSAEPDDDDTNADSYMDGEMGEEDEQGDQELESHQSIRTPDGTAGYEYDGGS
jgi:hypothetical protein